MFKKFLVFLLLLFIISPKTINASMNSEAKVGNNYYDKLEDAIANASSTDTIMLTSNVELNNTLNINKTVNIDLNGKNIEAPTKVFEVQGGVLNLTGKGSIKEKEPNYGAIMVKGSSDISDSKYSIVNVGSDVTLEGWSGIFVNHDNSKSYGVEVNLSGKINAISDTNGGEGIGVYVNGNIKDKTNHPVVNIKDGAHITSNGNGLYIAGYSTFNIKKAYIKGVESGIGIKAGNLNISGATIECDGEDKTPTGGYNNGMKPSGTTIQIESNKGYAGNINLNIKDGDFTSKNSHVIYEYIGGGNTTQVNSIDINNGTYMSEANKETLLFSNEFNNIHDSFITGGTYSSNPINYLNPNYTTSLNNDLYKVIKTTAKETFLNTTTNSNNNNFGIYLIITLSTISLVVLLFLNKNKIINMLKK